MKIKRQFYVMIAMLLAGNAMADNQVRRIQLLESAFAPTNKESLVEMFANAVKSRNGAVQYMLFCKSLQEKKVKEFQTMNWVSGTSSPSVASYQINEVSTNHFTIDYRMSLQGKEIETVQDKLEISQEPKEGKERYCISAYAEEH